MAAVRQAPVGGVADGSLGERDGALALAGRRVGGLRCTAAAVTVFAGRGGRPACADQADRGRWRWFAVRWPWRPCIRRTWPRRRRRRTARVSAAAQVASPPSRAARGSACRARGWRRRRRPGPALRGADRDAAGGEATSAGRESDPRECRRGPMAPAAGRGVRTDANLVHGRMIAVRRRAAVEVESMCGRLDSSTTWRSSGRGPCDRSSCARRAVVRRGSRRSAGRRGTPAPADGGS